MSSSLSNDPNNQSRMTSSFQLRTVPLPRTSYPSSITYGKYDLQRQDSRPDGEFYTSPRFVQHIDDGAIERLMKYYGGWTSEAASNSCAKEEQRHDGVIRAGDRVVDLCSSWTSHLPRSLRPGIAGTGMTSCVGYGLNGAEMKANEHLTSYHVRDLNGDTDAAGLLREVPSNSMDVVICNVSIDYLTRPIEVLSEARRVLRDGGTAHCAFSNRCFPSKVVGKWLRMNDGERRRWVGAYFWKDADVAEEKGQEGTWSEVEEVILNERGYEDPLFVVRARKVSRGARTAGSRSSEL